MRTGLSNLNRASAFKAFAGVVCVVFFGTSWAQSPGEQVFETTCAACHSIGGGRLVGPDLAGVYDKRSEEWLVSFVKSPMSMKNSGDADAVALFAEFNGIVMPDAYISDTQITEVLAYIKTAGDATAAPEDGGETVAAEPAAPVEAPAASPEEIEQGQNMFQGTIRFANGGPACNACHDVRNDAVIGGGVLAAELTTAFTRMGGSAGVRAILGSAPFPVMQSAYKGKDLTEVEVSALVAFLEYADSEEYNQLPRDYGIGLFVVGVVGAGVLFLLFGTIWRGRKVGSVNQEIYDRQVKSQSDDGFS
jgi:mono/diheme cytochrome c family protein